MYVVSDNFPLCSGVYADARREASHDASRAAHRFGLADFELRARVAKVRARAVEHFPTR